MTKELDMRVDATALPVPTRIERSWGSVEAPVGCLHAVPQLNDERVWMCVLTALALSVPTSSWEKFGYAWGLLSGIAGRTAALVPDALEQCAKETYET